jgi:hypothetical protein
MDLTELIPVWLEATKDVEVSTGLPAEEALKRASLLRKAIREGTIRSANVELTAEFVETLHALCLILEHDETASPERLLEDCEIAFDFVEALGRFVWHEKILTQLALVCWRSARRNKNASREFHWRKIGHAVSSDTWENTFREVVRPGGAAALSIGPETLLAICDHLLLLIEAEPTRALDAARLLHQRLGERTDIESSQDRVYFLGELALIAGTASRVLSKRDESRSWFGLAERAFQSDPSSSPHLERVGYQRLALTFEERNFASTLEQAPQLAERFRELDLAEHSLKCQFLAAGALKETDQFDMALVEFRRIRDEALAVGLDNLAALATSNISQIHAFLGEAEQTILEARIAAATLARLNNRIALPKVQLAVGYLLWKERRFVDAIEAFRLAQQQFAERQMPADIAAIHLVVADLFLEMNQASEARREILAALPVIDELRLVSEGIAALSLLRGSVQRQQIDREALRLLNDYFRGRSS